MSQSPQSGHSLRLTTFAGMYLIALVAKLRSIEGYRALFERAYPGQGISPDTIAKAIASFERTVVSTESSFDRWRKGDERAVSESTKRGSALFTQKAICIASHPGFNFTDSGFHHIGTVDVGAPDLRRFGVMPPPAARRVQDADAGQCRTHRALQTQRHLQDARGSHRALRPRRRYERQPEPGDATAELEQAG